MIIIRTNYDRLNNVCEPLNSENAIPYHTVVTEDEAVRYCKSMNAFCKENNVNYHFGYVNESSVDFE